MGTEDPRLTEYFAALGEYRAEHTVFKGAGFKMPGMCAKHEAFWKMIPLYKRIREAADDAEYLMAALYSDAAVVRLRGLVVIMGFKCEVITKVAAKEKDEAIAAYAKTIRALVSRAAVLAVKAEIACKLGKTLEGAE